MNVKEPLVLFGVSRGILEHHRNLYIKGGRFVDVGVTWKLQEGLLCEVEVIEGIAM